ncbi:MAG TPA: ester cyclase [Bradyrhizobium sp.]|nr:ester cyclase [Bradyrhizobium sp.]
MTKLEQNKAIARDYLNEIVNKGNLAAFDSYFSADVLFNGSRDLRQILARGQTMRRAFSGYHLIVRDQVAEGDKVVTRVTFHGTHTGPFNGIAPTGKQVEWPGMAMDRMTDGKVVEMWHLQNMTALMQQIGGAPPSTSKT